MTTIEREIFWDNGDNSSSWPCGWAAGTVDRDETGEIVDSESSGLPGVDSGDYAAFAGTSDDALRALAVKHLGDAWADATVDRSAYVAPQKSRVRSWETVETYTATFPNGMSEGSCTVEVQIGQDSGAWFLRTRDDAGGSDDADDTAHDSRDDAAKAAVAFAVDHDEPVSE